MNATTKPNLDAARYCYEKLGWSFTLLRGKIPVRQGWQTEERLPLDALERWDGNIGLRTGSASGVVVVDIDKPGEYELPETVMVRTGNGKHLYYSWSGGPLSGRVGKVFDGVDIRAEGNQVVFPGSVHPETGGLYEFVAGHAPWEIAMAPLPQWIAHACTKRDKRRKVSDKYLSSALEGEVRKVIDAEKGTRNNVLNAAAFSIGTILANGIGSRDEAIDALVDAGMAAGLKAGEVYPTVLSGIEAGLAQPREIAVDWKRKEETVVGSGLPLVVAPCVYIDGKAGTKAVRSGEFVDAVLKAMPDGLIFSRGGVPGCLVGEPGHKKWEILRPEVARVMIDEHCDLVKYGNKKGESEACAVRINCPKDLAVLFVENIAGRVPEIDQVVTYPTYTPALELRKAGFSDGVYYDEPECFKDIEPNLEVSTYANVIHELLCDFPFATQSDLTNFVGLMLTPILATALQGNRPIHLVTASIERTGKSKLAQDVLGGVLLGRSTPSMQLMGSEEERDKRIFAALLDGSSLLCADNVPEKINSPSLASLATTQMYKGRVLGRSQMLELSNTLTVVVTGNNTWCSGEIAKRIVPIVLQPRDGAPEKRTEFRHPDLLGWIRQNRRDVMAVLLGMVETWKLAGAPRSYERPKGGFEQWASAIQGVFRACCWGDWRLNEDTWTGDADDDSQTRVDMITAWFRVFGTEKVTAKELLALCEKQGMLGWIFESKSLNGQCMRLARWLRSHVRTPVAGMKIEIVKEAGYPNYYQLHYID